MKRRFESLLAPLISRWTGPADLRLRLLAAVWVFFLSLVALGIHGSSLPLTQSSWSPGMAYTGYLADYLPSFITGRAPLSERTRQLLMAYPRPVRSDEWITETPYALAQLAHKPAFPIINTNMSNGQNMLLWSWAGTPVLHILELARPSTWGYLFLGAQRGLAWSWWFPVFSCFTVLTLLIEVILKGHIKLAALASLWFCASAYVVAWSLKPAYVAMFPALACLCAYHLLKSTRPRVQIASGILLGLAIPGLLMFLYPPWQVSLGYLFLFIFIGLFWRDRLYRALWPLPWSRPLGFALAVLIAGGMTFEFLNLCWPAFQLAANTVYPGKREVFTGGNYPPWMFFRGFYNLITLYNPGEAEHLGNETESASHYYLFPAVFVALLFSTRLLRAIGPVGWMLAVYLAVMAVFALVGLPLPLTRFSLLGYAREVTMLDRQAGHPLWLCYGNAYPGTFVSMLGRRALSGVQWPPQMEFWHQLDHTEAYDYAYNRYAHVFMTYSKDADTVSFANPSPVVLQVTISPSHPALRSMGVRYILAIGPSQRDVETSKYRLIYVSRDGNSSIFEVPPSL